MSDSARSTAPALIGSAAPALTTRLLLALALLSAVAPFATDPYLPSFPAIADGLGTDATGVQLTLTAFLVGMAAGQLIFGPVSDRLGRRGPLIVGAVVFVLSSLVVAFAPTLTVLVAARLVQGLAGSAGMVLGRAVVSDLAGGLEAARAFTLMMIVGGVAPVVAPIAGSLLSASVGWRGTLGVLAGIAVLMLVVVLALVPETLPRERRARGKHAVGRPGEGERAGTGGIAVGGSNGVLRNRQYLAYAGVFVFAFASMMAYISASPFVYQDLIGLTPIGYAAAFGVNAIGLMVVSGLSNRLLDSRSPRQVLTLGLTSLGVSVAAVVVSAVWLPAALISVPLFFAVSSLGFILGPSTALALGAVRGNAGFASAVLGAAQFALAGLVSPLVSADGGASAVPMAVVMAAVVALAWACLVGAGRAAGRAGDGTGGGAEGESHADFDAEFEPEFDADFEADLDGDLEPELSEPPASAR